MVYMVGWWWVFFRQKWNIYLPHFQIFKLKIEKKFSKQNEIWSFWKWKKNSKNTHSWQTYFWIRSNVDHHHHHQQQIFESRNRNEIFFFHWIYFGRQIQTWKVSFFKRKIIKFFFLIKIIIFTLKKDNALR